MQTLIANLSTLIPTNWKRFLLGSSENPSWIAHIIHSYLNILRLERFPVLACSGILKPYRMRIDWYKYRSFIYGTWEINITKIIADEVSKGMTVLDIGGHIGFFTLLLAKLVEKDGKIYTFEPIPQNFKILEENIRINQLNYVVAVNKAISDRVGKEKLLIDEDDPFPVRSSLVQKEYTSYIEVETTSIDEFFKGAKVKIDFIKIDVEGAEEQVIRGALNIIKSCRPNMIIELHRLNDFDGEHPLINVLEDIGYTVSFLDKPTQTGHILAKPMNKI